MQQLTSATTPTTTSTADTNNSRNQQIPYSAIILESNHTIPPWRQITQAQS